MTLETLQESWIQLASNRIRPVAVSCSAPQNEWYAGGFFVEDDNRVHFMTAIAELLIMRVDDNCSDECWS